MTKSNIEFIKICAFCGANFIAFKSTTKYCSHACNSRDYKQNKRLEIKKKVDFLNEKIRNQSYAELNSKVYLNIKEAAKLLGIDDNTIYRYIYSGKLKATKLSARLTIISQKDIKLLFGQEYTYTKKNRSNYNSVEGYYTIHEIKEMYGIKDRQIWNIARVYQIPKIKIGKYTHISKKHIDNYFKKK